MKNYTLKSCEKLIETYVKKYGGEVLEISEGVLGLGKVLLYGAKGNSAMPLRKRGRDGV